MAGMFDDILNGTAPELKSPGTYDDILSAPPSNSTVAQETVKAIPRVAGLIGQGIGEAGQYASRVLGGDGTFGGGLRRASEELQKDYAMTPGFKEAHPYIAQGGELAEGVGKMVPYLAAGLPGLVALTAEAAGSQGERSFESAKTNGMSDGDAMQASILPAVASGAGMALMGPASHAAKGLLRAGAESLGMKAVAHGIEAVAQNLVRPSLRSLAGDVGSSVLVDAPIMQAQGAATAAAEKYTGARPDADPMKEVLANPKAWISSALTGGAFGAFTAAQRAGAAQAFKGVLSDGEFNPEQRAKVVNALYEHMYAADPSAANLWRSEALQDVNLKNPIDTSSDMLKPVMDKLAAEAQEKAGAKPPTIEEVQSQALTALAKSATTGEGVMDTLAQDSALRGEAAASQHIEDLPAPVEQAPAPQELSTDLSTPVENVDYTTGEITPAPLITNPLVAYKGYKDEKTATKKLGSKADTHEVVQRDTDGKWVIKPKESEVVATPVEEPVAPKPVASRDGVDVYKVDDNSVITHDTNEGVYTLREKDSSGNNVDVATFEKINGKIQNFKTAATAGDGYDREQQIQGAQDLVAKIEKGVGDGGVLQGQSETGAPGAPTATGGDNAASNNNSEPVRPNPAGNPSEPVNGKYRLTNDEVLRLAEKDLAKTTGQSFPPGSLRPAEGHDNTAAKLNKIASVWGRKVYLFEESGGVSGAPAGFFNGGTPDTIYIKATTKDPHLVIFGHELTHAIEFASKQSGDGVYDAFHKVFKEELATDKFSKYMDSYNKAHGTSYDAETFPSEAMAETVGHLMTDPAVWSALHEKNPTLIEKIAQVVLDILKPITTARYHAQLSASIFKDYSRIEKAATEMLAKAQKENVIAGDGGTQFSVAPEAKPWYSKLEDLFSERLKSVNQDKPLPRSHFENILKDKGLKADEVKASGLEEFLASRERFTAKEVQDELKANAVELKDVVLGDVPVENLTESDLDAYAKKLYGQPYSRLNSTEKDKVRESAAPKAPTHFSQYTEPGAKEGSYREMFVTAPNDVTRRHEVYKQEGAGRPWRVRIVGDEQHQTSHLTEEEARRVAAENDAMNQKDSRWQDGHSQYSDIQNPVVRVRFNERETDGKKILFVEEMQGPSDANQKNMPQFLRNRIYDLGVKRVLSYAKENGFDGVAWTPGEMQAKRYDLSKEVDSIEAAPNSNGTYELVFDMKNHGRVTKHDLTVQEVEDNVGKELAKKIVDDSKTWTAANTAYRDALRKTDGSISEAEYDKLRATRDAVPLEYSGLDLKVGGEGLKSLYDKTLPSLFKKYGGEGVERTDLGGVKFNETPDATTGFSQWRNEPQGFRIRTDGKEYVLYDSGELVNGFKSLREAQDAAQQIASEEQRGGLQAVPYIPITQATPASFMKFAASMVDVAAPSEKVAKGVTNFFKDGVSAKRLVKGIIDSTYRYLFPVDRSIRLAASQAPYAPIKAHLNALMQQHKEMAGYKSSELRDAGIKWQAVSKAFKTEGEAKTLSDLVWKATTYELRADGKDNWTPETWKSAGLEESTGKSLEDAQAEIKNLYSKLDPAQRLAHREMIDHVTQMYEKGREAELAPLKVVHGEDVVKEAEAYNKALDAKQDLSGFSQDAQDVAPLVRAVDMRYPKLQGDYMPLMRFGDTAVRTYETSNGEIGNRVKTEFFESPKAAIDAVNRINQDKTNDLHAKIEERLDARRDVINIPAAFLDKFRAAAEAKGFTGEALQGLMQSAEGLRINTLPRTTTKGNKLHRENIEGYSTDVVRSYLTYIRNHSIANAQLLYGSKVEQTFRDMRNEIDARDSDSSRPANPDDIRDMYKLYNHLYVNEKAGNTEKINELTKAVSKVTFLWYLSSPSTFAVQWAQPYMTTIPKLAARYGYGTSLASYSRSAKEYMAGRYSDEKIDAFDRENDYIGEKLSKLVEQSREALPIEREALEAQMTAMYNSFSEPGKVMSDNQKLLVLKVLSHQGAIDLSMSHMVGDEIAGSDNGTKTMNKIIDKAGIFMQKSETGSRRAAAISSFGLAAKDGFLKAHDYAADIIDDTLFNFDSQNRGEMWRGNTGRILGQFQFFRFHMVGKTIQLLKDAAGGEYDRSISDAKATAEANGYDVMSITKNGESQHRLTKDGKAYHSTETREGMPEDVKAFFSSMEGAEQMKSEARQELAYQMGSAFALAGAGGTPIAMMLSNSVTSALWAGISAMFEDPDDPWNVAGDFEKGLREAVGDTTANLFMKGLPSLVGADISRRIGAGGMMDIIQGDPPPGLTGTAKANWYAGRILGPAWGVASDTIRGMDALADGDLSEYMRMTSPKPVRDLFKTAEVYNNGVQGGGKTLLKSEDVSPWSFALMLAGINPMDVSLAQQESRYLKNISTSLSQRRASLVKGLATASAEQDVDGQEEAIEKLNHWSEKNPALKVTAQELASAVKRERDKKAGVLSKREQIVKSEYGVER